MSEKESTAGVDVDARSAAYSQMIKGDINRVVRQHDPYLAEDLDAMVDELMAARAVVEASRSIVAYPPIPVRNLDAAREAYAAYDRLESGSE